MGEERDAKVARLRTRLQAAEKRVLGLLEDRRLLAEQRSQDPVVDLGPRWQHLDKTFAYDNADREARAVIELAEREVAMLSDQLRAEEAEKGRESALEQTRVVLEQAKKDREEERCLRAADDQEALRREHAKEEQRQQERAEDKCDGKRQFRISVAIALLAAALGAYATWKAGQPATPATNPPTSAHPVGR